MPPFPPRPSDLLVATAFLTRIPVAAPAEGAAGALARAVPMFPVVGAIVGAMAALVHALAGLAGLPSLVSALLAVLAGIAVTGALHEDGLADLADGLGARGGPEQRLEVMRDSRIGAYGVLALIFSVALRAAAIEAVGAAEEVLALLVGAHACSRGLVPQLMLRLPPARIDGLAASAGRPSSTRANLSALFGILLGTVAMGGWSGLAGVAAAAIAALGVAGLARARLGGQTGDVLGAAQQTAEIAFMLAVFGTF